MPAMKKPGPEMLSIVIVNWRSWESLLRSLSVLQNTCETLPFEVIIVDNDSRDNGSHELCEKFPEVRLISNSENIGFARAANLGIEASTRPYILLLNPDASIPSEDVSEMMFAIQSDPSMGACAALLTGHDGRVHKSWSRFPTVFRQLLHQVSPVYRLPSWRSGYLTGNRPVDVDWFIGACMLLRREALLSIGLFDEKLKLYGEDMDLCFRLRAQGWRVALIPAARATHETSADDFDRAGNPRKALAQGAIGYFLEKHGMRASARLIRCAQRIVSCIGLVSWLLYWMVRPGARNHARRKISAHSACLFVRYPHHYKLGPRNERPYHVLQIITGLHIGGAESVLLSLCRGLLQDGDRATVLALKDVGAGADRLRELEIEVLPASRWLCHVPELIRAMRVPWGEGVSVIHTHLARADMFGFVLSLLTGLPFVVTRHGSYEPAADKWAFRKAYPFVLRQAEIVVAVSRWVADCLVNTWEIPRKKIQIAYNGVTPTAGSGVSADVRDEVRRGFQIPASCKVVGCVGRLSEEKGQKYLLRAAVGILAREPQTVFLLVGDGPEKVRLQDIAAHEGIADKVIFAGWRNDIQRLLPAMDIFVAPSLDEGLGVGILEAMAASVPVVAFATGGIPEVIRNGQDGVLVPSRDKLALTDAVCGLLLDPARGEVMAQSARDRLDSHFTARQMVDSVISLYDSVCRYDKK